MLRLMASVVESNASSGARGERSMQVFATTSAHLITHAHSTHQKLGLRPELHHRVVVDLSNSEVGTKIPLNAF